MEIQAFFLLVSLLLVGILGDTDLDALLELRKGLKGDASGKVLVSWDSKSIGNDGCPRNWYGVSCADGRVSSISIDDAGIFGDFSFPAISSLKMLVNLSVSNNQLSGDILSVGSLESLEVLDLSGNLFRGEVPIELTNLTNLVVLNLSSNSFGGELPSGFGRLQNLTYLDLRDNGFSGEVMQLLSQLSGVEYVDLSCNRFNGSLDLGLADASFVSTLGYLNISSNTLGGELFAHDGMPYLDNLQVFDASNNKFVGNVPSFGFVVSLSVLRLGNNQLSGSLPEALLQESSMVLSELDLSFNHLEGPIGSITSRALSYLNLSSNRLSGSLPTSIGHCALVDLSNNMLSGDLSRMQTWGNYVEVIQLSGNSLSGSLPNVTSQFLRLSSLKIANNSAEGAVPLVLCTYPVLKIVDLSWNRLNGSLLPCFFTSTRWIDLNLSGNNFSGPLLSQDSLDILSVDSAQNFSMVSLDLSFNSFDGVLPREIGSFHNLLYLYLSHNQFVGSLPDTLPDGLKGFNVTNNNFSGEVPENLRRFPESSFHPGNTLLVLPSPHSFPQEIPGFTIQHHHKFHIKPSIRAAIISACIGAVASMACVSAIIWYRTRQKESQENIRNDAKKGDTETKSPVLTSSSLSKSQDQPVTSSSPKGGVPISQLGSVREHEGTSSAVERSLDSGHSKFSKDVGLTSPMSAKSSSNPSPSKTPSVGTPVILKVSSPDKLAGDLHLFNSSLIFTAEELSHAPAEMAGRSCHGTLYKATLGGHKLAVKWLREGIAKGKKEFAREAKKLGNIKHPNLVSLQGYYWGPKEHEKLLISNYIEAPCLAAFLQEKGSGRLPPLLLDQRLKIAQDVSCCLSYLHNERSIPHGNLKDTNIVLETPNFNCLLTDYSLHRIMTPAGTAEQVLSSAALGYMPPEFASSSKPCPSLKSDVYAFGVILLELITGKISGEIASSNPGAIDLVEWVGFLVAGNRSSECYDGLLLGEHSGSSRPPKVLEDLLEVALRCVLPASERPDMKDVFEEISSLL